MNKAKMIILNLILLAGITTSISTAFAGIQNDRYAGSDSDQNDLASTELCGDNMGGSTTEGNDNCTLIPVGDGCSVCAGCSGQCSLR